MFHKHKWIKNHEYTGRSPVQQLSDSGVTRIKGVDLDDPSFYAVPHVVVYLCEDCGKLKVIKVGC